MDPPKGSIIMTTCDYPGCIRPKGHRYAHAAWLLPGDVPTPKPIPSTKGKVK